MADIRSYRATLDIKGEKTVLIAQISDIHAGMDNDNLQRLDRALSWLDVLAPDALVVSGDLIDEGSEETYAAIAERLDKLAYPVLVLPGNSDDRTLVRSFFGGSHRVEGLRGAAHFTTRINRLRLIGIDASIAGSPAGDVTNHLPWLKEALDEPGTDASLVFLHHHVVASGIPPIDAAICQGALELGRLLADHARPPLALSSGHVHRPMAGMLVGIPAHVCGSICPANPLWFGTAAAPPVNAPPMLMVHRLAGGILVSNHISV